MELALGEKFQFDAHVGTVCVLGLHCLDTYSKSFLRYGANFGPRCSEDAYSSLRYSQTHRLESAFQVCHRGYILSQTHPKHDIPSKVAEKQSVTFK